MGPAVKPPDDLGSPDDSFAGKEKCLAEGLEGLAPLTRTLASSELSKLLATALWAASTMSWVHSRVDWRRSRAKRSATSAGTSVAAT